MALFLVYSWSIKHASNCQTLIWSQWDTKTTTALFQPPTALQRWRGILRSTLMMDGLWKQTANGYPLETNIAAWCIKYPDLDIYIYVLYWKIGHVPASYVCWQEGSQLGYLSNIGCHLLSPCEHMFCIFWQGISWFLDMFMIKCHASWESGLKSLHPNIISLNISITYITVQPVPTHIIPTTTWKSRS